MGKISIWSRDNPLIILLILTLISAFFAYHVKHIKLDSSTKAIVIEDDPARTVYDETLAVFGSDNLTIVYIKDADLFTRDKLTAAEDVFYNLQDIPGVTRVDGLFNATNFKGEDGILTTSPLMDWVPEGPAELAQIRADALQNPLLNRTLISPKANAIAFTVTVDPDPADPNFNIRIANDIDKVIESLSGKVDQVFQVGVPMTRRFIRESIQKDLRTVSPLAMSIFLIVFIIGIRTVNGAFLPLLTGGLSSLWTIGFMAISDIPINILTWFIPFLIFVVGSTEDMHLLSEYLMGLEHEKNRFRAIEYMAHKTGLAVFLTGLTTFLGFLCIVLNQITLLKQFGMAAAFGLFVNPIITFTFVPVYLRFFGRKNAGQTDSTETREGGFLNNIADGLLYLVNSHGKLILAILVIVTCLASIGIFSVKVDNDLIGYFKSSSDIRVRSRQLHNELSGMQNFYIVFDADREGAFKQSANLKPIFEVQEFIERIGRFDSSISLADHVALVHREMADGDSEKYIVPDRDDLISQYLLFFTREDIERYVSPDYSQTNIHVRHNLSSSHDLKVALNELRPLIETTVGGEFSFHITGESILFNEAADTIAVGQVYSLGLILSFIFIIMTLLFVRFKVGLLALVPNLVPIIFLFGLMGFTGIPLNPGTALVAACAIGIAVDDTIHLFTRYNDEMKRLNDPQRAITETVRGDLRPVLISSTGLAIGFSLLGFANLVPTVQFGLLSAAVMIFAFFADLLISPILLSRTKLITVWDLLGLHLTKNVVEQSELFREMSRTQIKKVVLLGKIRTAQANDYIVRQGERERTMYLILEGSANVERTGANGDRVLLSTLSEGDVFGEIALVNEVGRTANVIAAEETKILSIDWDSLERIRKIFPRIATRFFLNISRILGLRLALTDIHLAETNKDNS